MLELECTDDMVAMPGENKKKVETMFQDWNFSRFILEVLRALKRSPEADFDVEMSIEWY